jgi:DNA polymerase-3 subunit beta
MQFSILQPALRQALTLAGSHLGKSGVFGMVAIEAIGNELRVSARNLDSGINCFMPAIVTRAGGILLPEKLLADLVGNFSPERVDFDLDPKTSRVKISCQRSVATIPGVPLKEMPGIRSLYAANKDFAVSVPEPDAHLAFFGLESLRIAIESTTFAASDDDSRPTLTGIDLSLSGIAAKFAATDGYRLSVAQSELEAEFGEMVKMVIPSSRLDRLVKVLALGDRDSRVDMLFTRNWALFTVPCSGKSSISTIEIETALIDAKFPDYNGIIPKSRTNAIRVERDELKKALRVTGLYARDNANIVRFVLNDGVLKVTAESSETGNCSVEVNLIECESREPLMIAFNYKFLADYLDRAEPDLWMEFTTSMKPVKISSVASRDGNDFYVLMPMQPK